MEDLHKWISELSSGDDERAEAAVGSLAAHPAAALPALAELLKSPDTDTRWWAVRATSEFAGPQALTLLLAGLKDPDAAVRQCAALGLRAFFQRMAEKDQALAAALGDQRLGVEERVIPALGRALNDEDHLAADLAADTLVSLGRPAVPALLGVLQEAPHPARLRAVRGLAQIADPRAIPALMAALQEDSALMEYWASEGLDRMGLGLNFFDPGG